MPVYTLVRSNPDDLKSPQIRSGVTEHDGRVLSLESRSDRIMSDVWDTGYYAIVWNDAANTPVDVYLGGQEFGPIKQAEVDATPEAIAAYEAWLAAREAERAAAEDARLEANAESRLREVVRGCPVMVTRGRKIPKGTTGRVFWIGQKQYGVRVGFEADDGVTHWTDINNVDRIIPPKPEGMSWREFESFLYEVVAAA